MSVDRRIALFGTLEPAAARKRYTVGPLEFTFEGGGIRHVCFNGVEVVRGIQYLLRDANWATPAIELGEVTEAVAASDVHLSFPGRVRTASIAFDLRAEVTASASGELRFSVTGTAGCGFAANRVGFTVLHPTPECEDIGLEVEHLASTPQTTRFPLEISPSQPVFDIRTLGYSPGEGVGVRCELHSKLPDGRAGSYEMEDQRNWSDASYKTYVGSLLEPWPFDVAESDVFEQAIAIRCTAVKPLAPSSSGAAALRVELGPESAFAACDVGLAVPEGGAAQALAHGEVLAGAGARHLTAYLRAGAHVSGDSLADLGRLAAALSVPVHLEIELPCDEPPRAELDAAAAACAAADLRPASVLACPAAYLKSYQPTERWPDVPPLDEIYAAARGAFANSQIGGGMLSYFTELNRKWPPASAIDFVSHTVSPVVHAGDDATLMENLATIRAMAATVTAELGSTEHRLGPCAISMRHNPYGQSTLENADGQRMAMCDADPRERGLFGAAWALGLVASARAAGIRHLTLFAASGPRSVVYSPGTRPQPWFDDTPRARIKPLFHVFRGLAALGGSRVRDVGLAGEGGRRVSALAAETNSGIELWLANLTEKRVDVQLPAQASLQILDTASFEAACCAPDWLDGAEPHSEFELTLDAYAVARCRIDN